MSNTTFNAKEAVIRMLDGAKVTRADNDIVFYMVDFEIKSGISTSISIRDFLHKALCSEIQFYVTTQNLVKWYRPKFTWQENSPNNAPSEWQEDKDFYPTKKAFLDSYDKKGIHEIKVLKWEIEYFPPMYEECE